MTDKIKYKITKEASKGTIALECPHCKGYIQETIDKGQQKGKRKCFLCECEFEWEREADNAK